MKFGARLEEIASMIEQAQMVIDVGTDHAYLPVLLVEQGRTQRAIATDIAAGPCQAARNTVAQYGFGAQIEVRQGDGLAQIKPEETEVIAIAGMGAKTMITILEAAPSQLKAAKRLVLQPMNELPRLRVYLAQQGWRLVQEELVEDEGKLYVVMAAERGEIVPATALEQYVGPLLLKNKPPLLKVYLEQLLQKAQRVLTTMEASESAKQGEKYQALKQRQEQLEELYHDNCQ